MHLDVYCDGSCLGNPGPGGWAWVAIDEQGKIFREGSGNSKNTTNNRMELMAAIEALEELPIWTHINLYVDSNYVKSGISDWIRQWKKSGWLTSAKLPVKNKDLWEKLDIAILTQDVTWHWTPGHSGDKWNDYVDFKARDKASELVPGGIRQIRRSK